MTRFNWKAPIKSKYLVLFGTGDLARIAYEYFTNDSEYRVVAFTVDREYLQETEFCGLPVIPFDEIDNEYTSKIYHMHVCVVYGHMNRLRQARCEQAKAKGYKLASYVSSYAFVSPSAKLGEHHFIFENNVIQPFVAIGDNCILWSGNHCGHHSTIEDNVFISSHVVISGHCHIGRNSFLGVNSTLANGSIVGEESWLSHNSIVSGEIPPHSFVKCVQSEFTPLNEAALNRALERAKK